MNFPMTQKQADQAQRLSNDTRHGGWVSHNFEPEKAHWSVSGLMICVVFVLSYACLWIVSGGL